jgi:hypothetical protein
MKKTIKSVKKSERRPGGPRKCEESSVERPLHRKPYLFCVDGENQCFDGDIVEAERYKWSFLTARRFWVFGFKSKEIALFLNSIPLHVSNSLASLLNEQEIQLMQRATQHKWLQQTCGDSILSHANSQYSGLDTSLWEQPNSCGYLSLSIDPPTQNRKEVAVNSNFPIVSGLHNEELLARFANHDLDMFCPPLDFIFFCANDSIHGLDSRDRYFRFFSNAGGSVKRTTLVCNSIKRLFDSTGRIRQVAVTRCGEGAGR